MPKPRNPENRKDCHCPAPIPPNTVPSTTKKSKCPVNDKKAQKLIPDKNEIKDLQYIPFLGLNIKQNDWWEIFRTRPPECKTKEDYENIIGTPSHPIMQIIKMTKKQLKKLYP